MAIRLAVLVGFLLAMISPLGAQAGQVKIVVTDVTEATIAKAQVALLGTDGKAVRSQVSDERGVSRWSGLLTAEAKFRITAPGFLVKTTTVTIRNSEELSLKVVLEVDPTFNESIIDTVPLLPVERR